VARAGALAAGGGALAAFFAAAWIAANHPLLPLLALGGLLWWTAAVYRFPRSWLFVLPASLPWLNFAPWTGWTQFEEFDLVVLGALAGGYARFAVRGPEGTPPLPAWGRVVIALLAALTLLSLWRGVNDAGELDFGWYQDYTGPLNSLRVTRSALYALLLLPLVRRDAMGAGGQRLFGLGMLAGIVAVALAALWERAAYPGLFDFDEPYRTTALFWEMRVGGAAIDAYLALATPFVAWALWAARSRWWWLAAALLTLVWAYVCLTSFSRGAYLGVVTPLLLLGFFKLLGGRGWRRVASSVLALALIAEIAVVLGWGSFMISRTVSSERDYQSRMQHWARGIELLQGPADWWLGIGAGRLPAHYARAVPGAAFAGRVHLIEGQGRVELLGPRTRAQLGGLFGLTQRVPLRARYRVSFDARVTRPTAVQVWVCEAHLLYDRACQGAEAVLRAAGRPWQHVALELSGPPLSPGAWFAPRMGVLTVSVVNAGGSVELTRMALEAPGESQLLKNPDFAAGLAHWLPAAQYYFIPWHIDNLFLEWLIERGLLSLFAFVAIVAVLAARLRRRGSLRALEPFVAASLLGVLCVGLVSSVLDAPRVALLMFLMMGLLSQGSSQMPGAVQKLD
jgi:hypothetical protein